MMSFEDLPDEIWTLIFSHLDTDETIRFVSFSCLLNALMVPRISTVSKHWLERTLKLTTILNLTRYPTLADRNLINLSNRCSNSNVTSLNIGGCRELSNEMLDCINNFVNLHSLEISYCHKFRSFEKLSTLTNLRRLNLCGCDDFDDTHLELLVQNAKNIISLDLSGCLKVTMEGISHLHKLKNLQEFYFLNCLNITNKTLKYISMNTALTTLKLGWCFRVKDVGISYLTNLKNLKDLHLHESRKITDLSISYIAKLENIKRIYLSDCSKLTDACCSYIEALNNLEELYIGDVILLTYVGIGHIARNKNIKYLSLPGCNLKNEGLSALSEYATQLKGLCLTGCNQLSQTSITMAFGSWKSNLTHLSLKGCFPLTDETIRLICKTKSLENLNLGGCHQLTNGSLLYIGTLPNLNTLNLYSCINLTDKGLSFLKTLKSLLYLDLSGCTSISDQGVFDLILSEDGCLNIKQLLLFGCRNITNYCIEFIQTMKKGVTLKKST